jgi:hypothetical protein
MESVVGSPFPAMGGGAYSAGSPSSFSGSLSRSDPAVRVEIYPDRPGASVLKAFMHQTGDQGTGPCILKIRHRNFVIDHLVVVVWNNIFFVPPQEFIICFAESNLFWN